MVQLLLAILSALGVAVKNTWNFVKAKFLMLWVFASVVLPKVLDTWRSFRLIRLACAGFLVYAIYTTINTTVLGALSIGSAAVGLSQLISNTSWASWLVWDGPLQGEVLWEQLISCLSLRISLQVIAYTLTKLGWWQSSVLGGGLGPRQ